MARTQQNPSSRASTRERSWSRLRHTALLVALSLAPRAAYGEEQELSRARVAALAVRAPGARVANAEAAVARAAVAPAGALSLDNPVISGLGGVRFNADGTRPFAGVASLSWPVDVTGQRAARRDAARAGERAARATATEHERKLLLAALLQHAAVLRDDRALALALARHALSERVSAAAQRRYAAGGVPELDVALAAIQEKRDASAAASALGSRDLDKLALLSLLGAPGDPDVTGTLVPDGEVPALRVFETRLSERPDLRAASAAVNAAEAKAERERAARTPSVNLLAQYERDDGDNIGLLGLEVPLPILNANELERATSAAEVDVARARAAETRSNAAGHLKALYTRYLATQAALAALMPSAALATRAVNLATRGYELGENDLASVLLVRREAIEAESALLEAEHAHASAKLELLVAAGRVPR